ncbi:MAG: IclR family transcriptional regulator [Rhodospirillales bacterium]|nr:IclR family transcriptional regulator [Rhodospirillales bacterium]
MNKRAHSQARTAAPTPSRPDPLLVQSVEKAFRVLTAFDRAHPTMSLTQLAAAIDLDKSATQRFTHTLVRLGYLRKDMGTKRFELTVKTLDLGRHYTQANPLVDRAMPYLLHLSKTTEETVNLTVLDDTEIVFVARFMSRHVLKNDVIIGTRMPAFCTASGIAILSHLPRNEARDILQRSDLKAFTPHTTFRMGDLIKKLDISAARGYATAFEEFYHGDLSIAAPVVDHNRRSLGAINIAVSRARFSPKEAEEQFSSLVVAAAASISHI